MIDRPLIEKKLRKIEEFLKELKIVDIENYEEFKRSSEIYLSMHTTGLMIRLLMEFI